MDLAAKRQASGGFDPARAGRSRLAAGTGTLPGRARSLPGPREVSARPAGGPREGGQGSIAGLRQVNGGWLHGLAPPSATRDQEPFMRDDTRPGRPARRAGTRQPVPPAMPAAAQPGGAALSPLDSADASFRALTTGPQPLALHTASPASALPDRQIGRAH